MKFNEYLELDYTALIEAANKITGNHELSIDLLHYAIEELSNKPNVQDIVDSGGARFYIIRICMTQWRSQTGPFYRQFVKKHDTLDYHDKSEPETESVDVTRINKIIDSLDWYDRELFKLFAEGRHNFSTLSVATGIPRTSISLTIKRVRKHIKKHLD